MSVLLLLRDLLVWNLRASGVVTVGKDPSSQAIINFGLMNRHATRHKCAICNRMFWSWKDRKTCNSWSCYRIEMRAKRKARRGGV